MTIYTFSVQFEFPKSFNKLSSSMDLRSKNKYFLAIGNIVP